VGGASGSQSRCVLSEGLRKKPDSTRSVTGPGQPLMELHHPSEYLSEKR
jgi:hypothetical protein